VGAYAAENILTGDTTYQPAGQSDILSWKLGTCLQLCCIILYCYFSISFSFNWPFSTVTPGQLSYAGSAGPLSKLLGVVAAELLHSGCPSCHPYNSIKALKDKISIFYLILMHALSQIWHCDLYASNVSRASRCKLRLLSVWNVYKFSADTCLTCPKTSTVLAL